MLSRLVLGILGALLLVACGHHNAPQTDRPVSSQPPSADPSTHPTSAHELDCSAHLPAHLPPASYDVVLGAVGLQVWPSAGVLQASTEHMSGAPRLFAKTGLLVRAGVSSTITVQAPPRRVARIGWRNGLITPARRVEVPACPPDGKSKWLAFPGGYWVDGPACVRLTVYVRGDAESERVAVGERFS